VNLVIFAEKPVQHCFQRNDTDGICGSATRCSITSFVTAVLWSRSGYRGVEMARAASSPIFGQSAKGFATVR